jgi:hypothetical protein
LLLPAVFSTLPDVNRAPTYLLSVLSLLLLVGCKSPPTTTAEPKAAELNAYMTRADDVRENRHAPRMAFAKNDKPTAVVENLGAKEQQVAVEFIRQDTGKVVFQSAFPVARNETRHIAPRETLPAGSYNLKVTPGNSAPIVQNFSVYGY